MRTTKNWLAKYFENNRGRLIDKWVHYFDIYDNHFSRFRGQRPVVLEIGVYHGGSLQMWKKYFGRGAEIIGLDIDDRTQALSEPGARVIIGDQSDRSFLQRLRSDIGPVDIVIDDGGHTMNQQIVSFEELWPTVKDGGLYLAEDLHTSYWSEYGGGYRQPGTFIEYVKALIDQEHAWHARPGDGLEIDAYTRSIRSIHVYDSVIVIEKANVARPYSERTGTPAFPMLDDR